MSEADFIFRSMKTHHVLVILVVDTRVLSCVADSFQERRFARISPTHYKDTKVSISHSKLIGIKVAHGRCGWVKGEWERCGSVARVGTLLTITSPNGTFCFVPSKTDSLATLFRNYVHPIRLGRRRNMECTNLLHGLWMSVSYFSSSLIMCHGTDGMFIVIKPTLCETMLGNFHPSS